MTRDEALAKLVELDKSRDTEGAHWEADDVLCEFLRSLGYGDVADAFEAIGKWYA